MTFIYKFFIKTVGISILASLWFHPTAITHVADSLYISSQLNTPVTKEIQQLIEKGLHFKVEYSIQVKINTSQKYRQTLVKTLSFSENSFFLNNQEILEEELQDSLGVVDLKFPNISLKKQDQVSVIIRAYLLNDENFYSKTRLESSALWNYHVPYIHSKFIFDGTKLVKTYES